MTNAEANTAATVAERGAHVAPEQGSSKKGATRRKGAHRGQKTAKGGKGKARPKKETKPTRAKEAGTPREGSKTAKVLALLGRKEGATLAQLMKATGWQAHSVRGFLSGALGKKMALKIESQKQEDGERTYKLAK
jgi:Protein of unknown function (DUF3489)